MWHLAPISTYLNTSEKGAKVLSSERCGFLMVRLGYKGFTTSVLDQEKYDRLRSKVLRLLVLMDAVKGAAASEVTVVSANEPHTSTSFNLECRMRVASILSLYLPTWFLLLMVVVCDGLRGWIVREIRMRRVHVQGRGGYGADEGEIMFEQPRDGGDDPGEDQ